MFSMMVIPFLTQTNELKFKDGRGSRPIGSSMENDTKGDGTLFVSLPSRSLKRLFMVVNGTWLFRSVNSSCRSYSIRRESSAAISKPLSATDEPRCY